MMVAIQLTDITDMIEEIMSDDNNDAKVYLRQLGSVQEKVIGNIGMELSNLAVLVTDPAIISSFFVYEGCSLLDWSELNTSTEPIDIILEFPETNLDQWKPMMMLMVNQLIKSLEGRPPRTYNEEELPPILVNLDEFPRLGMMSAIKNGLHTLRSRGVTFVLFVQSIADLDELYGHTTARVIAELCPYKAVLGVADVTSAKYYSDAVGTIESTQRSVSVDHDSFSGRAVGYGRTISETRAPIMYPEEFLTMDDVVVINPHSGFFRVNKMLYVENKELFLLPQLLKDREYAIQNRISYNYNPEGDR